LKYAAVLIESPQAMLSRFLSSASYERRLVLTCAILFSLLAWGALIFAVVDLI
jgi:hypothetical protein